MATNANMPDKFKLDLSRTPRRVCTRRWLWQGISLGLIFAGVAAAAEDAATRLPPDFRQLAPVAAIQEAAQAALQKLTGLALPEAREKIRPGDSVTILVSLTTGKELKQWLFTLIMEEPNELEKKRPHDSMHLFTSTGHEFRFDGGRAGIRITMIGPLKGADAGRKAAISPEIKRQRVLVDADYLALGLERVPAMMLRIKAHRAADPSLTHADLSFGDKPFPPEVVAKSAGPIAANGVMEADERAFMGSILALQEFLLLASRTPELRDVLMSVLDVPWWSILRSGGNLNFNIAELPFERELNAAAWGLPAQEKAYASPFLLSINGKPALLFQLALVAPKPPLTVSAGIIGLAAGAPNGKGPVLTFQVIASRAAPEPAKP